MELNSLQDYDHASDENNNDESDNIIPEHRPSTSYSMSANELRQRRVLLRHYTLPHGSTSASTSTSPTSSSTSAAITSTHQYSDSRKRGNSPFANAAAEAAMKRANMSSSTPIVDDSSTSDATANASPPPHSQSPSSSNDFTPTPTYPMPTGSTSTSSDPPPYPAQHASPNDEGSSSSSSSSAKASGSSTKADGGESKEEEKEAMYECNICLDTASNPVVTLCGHLFCWPCVHRWMESRSPSANTCPVCKAGLEKAKLIPIYSRGRTTDPRTQSVPIPERPAGQRPAPPPRRGFGGFGVPGGIFPEFGGIHQGFHSNGIHFAAGFGPFGLFPMLGMQFNLGGGQAAPQNQQNPQAAIAAQQAFISRIFLLIGALIFIGILLY
ncbi:hypothetical protein HDU76_008478 [Blyttiomyces sp. JEL0837]|nr:hypothetical protein HDU76_008478 [Blyttiomyces sp. JEL0837]